MEKQCELRRSRLVQLIDKDTPSSAYTYKAYEGGDEMELVFSDEFNDAGRTFYDGDDPYFQAVDIWYGATVDLEVSFSSSQTCYHAC